MEQPSDQEVVSAVLQGNVDAYAVLVKRYQKPIYNLMLRMTNSTADALDLAQETFIKAFEALDRFRKDSRFFPWLYSIGLNHSRNFLRRNKAHPKVDMDDREPGAAAYYDADQKQSRCDRLDVMEIRDALSQLPVDYREAVLLRYREEFSMEEIAEALQISLSGAKMRVHRGLKKLREMLEKNGNGDE